MVLALGRQTPSQDLPAASTPSPVSEQSSHTFLHRFLVSCPHMTGQPPVEAPCTTLAARSRDRKRDEEKEEREEKRKRRSGWEEPPAAAAAGGDVAVTRPGPWDAFLIVFSTLAGEWATG